MPREILFVVGATELDKSDELIRSRLIEQLVYDVEVVAGRDMLNHHLMNKELVVLSSTAAKFGDGAKVISILRDAPIPVLVLGTELLKGLKMAAESYVNTEQIDYIVEMGGGLHPMTAGFNGEVTISKGKRALFFVEPFKSFYEIASLKLNENQRNALSSFKQNQESLKSVCLYAYDVGDIMLVEGKNKEKIKPEEVETKVKSKLANCITAPARRVCYIFDKETPTEATKEGWCLFEAAVRWAVSLKTTDEIFAEEWSEICTRREGLKGEHGEITREGCYKQDESGVKNGLPPDNLVGIALSGGGIRSATFSLGLLQGLHNKGFLTIFDYLSTVSGGGFLGGWWSAWLSRQDTKGIFPKAEKLEPLRANIYLGNRMNNRSPEGSLCARNEDPIHHLRLFSNYLTPRKGALSADTWSAVADISRNLMLTWLSLLPILFSFVLLGQFYFLLQKDSAYEYLYPFRNRIADIENPKPELSIEREYAEWFEKEGPNLTDEERQYYETEKNEEIQSVIKKTQDDYHTALWNRAKSSRFVILPIAGWIILMSLAWLRSNVTKNPTLDWLAHTFASLVLILLFFCILCLIKPDMWDISKIRGYLSDWKYSISLWVGVGLVFYFLSLPRNVKEPEWRKEIRKNRVSQIHAGLLIGLVIATFFLALSAYGYDIANYIWFDSMRQGHIAAYIAKAGGIFTLVFSILGSIFTAVKSAPAGGGDKNTGNHLTNTSKFILFITPPLVLITLTIMLSWFAHHCIFSLTNFSGISYNRGLSVFTYELAERVSWHEQRLMAAVILSIVLGFFFAVYELKKWEKWETSVLSFFALLGFCVLCSWLITLIRPNQDMRNLTYWKWHWLCLFTMAFFVGAIICYRFCLFRKQRIRQLNELRTWLKILITFTAALVIAIGLAFLSYWAMGKVIEKGILNAPYVDWLRSSLTIAGILFCGIAVTLEMFLSRKNTSRSASLLTGAYIILFAFLLSSFFSSSKDHLEISLAYLTMALLTLALGWTIAIGWMADPNWLSMHLFYKARLVRSYLGASNPNRKVEEITQSAIGDDVLMYELTNCQKGAPYHLINTTLNLVGAKDLATAQRSSSYFTISKLYCGSLRTGYRRTREYMEGRFSLGTAVAVSGAAISPNMGVKTQTAALSMLMTLLNVRLGFWSPTPSNANWRSPNPKLWPFYTLREFLSQTNDLGSYCYLTDGGHFDNTGLYALVERGCRYIVVSDNGADPLPCFEDLGDAIRRCRIDFNAEIELDISPLFKKKDEASGDQLANTHYVVGTIKYSEAHLHQLGWEADEKRREGIIILIKPSLLSDERADLRQYGRQNSEFPHQSTGDQWFDEAQFESYRRLGERCAEKVFKELFLSTFAAQDVALTPKMIEDAFNLAKQTYDEHLNKAKGDLNFPEVHPIKFMKKNRQSHHSRAGKNGRTNA